MFWEAVNAIGVLKAPVIISIWDDGYGISVTRDLQTVKQSISKALKGFEKDEENDGIIIYNGKGWDYAGIVKMFEDGIERSRKDHIPVLFHVEEMVQPMGHSTAGSQERYKSRERLDWEAEYDPIKKMEEWILETGIASKEEVDEAKNLAAKDARESRDRAWKAYIQPILEERDDLLSIIDNKSCDCRNEGIDKIGILTLNLKRIMYPIRKDIQRTAKRIMRHLCSDCPVRAELQESISTWIKQYKEENHKRYSTLLYSESDRSALKVEAVAPHYPEDVAKITGREILLENFDQLLKREPRLVIFGEDTGKIGDVNKSLDGLQAKYGDLRVTDTGIRETTIIGQGIGMALRGLRPIAEIQYFDYILYALETISDDLATLHWRTKGAQIAPIIIRTRGHRLEGIWHSGSPLSMVINSIRGVYVCVPRNMTQAAGMYNTLLNHQVHDNRRLQI